MGDAEAADSRKSVIGVQRQAAQGILSGVHGVLTLCSILASNDWMRSTHIMENDLLYESSLI